MNKKHITIFLFLFIALGLSLQACKAGTLAQLPTPSAAPIMNENSSPSQQIISVWLPPFLPDNLKSGLVMPESTIKSSNETTAEIRLDISADAPVSRWVYALVAPFSTVTDEISSSAIKAIWSGELSDAIPVNSILIDGNTRIIFEKLWGPASIETVRVTSSNTLLEESWNENTSWAIIPFDKLEPRWKVISVDGISPIRKNFDATRYPLTVPFSWIGDPKIIEDFNIAIKSQTAAEEIYSNRDPKKMTTVAMTGVTALVRGTAYLMETKGLTYPAMDVGEILRNADITHISNEIPFVTFCPKPFTDKESENKLVFCSKPEYIQLLESIGTDVVELTGDHFRDWGAQAMLDTLEMYIERGWQYYGGGSNLEDGWEPALFEHNGNRIAFIGCNGKASWYATASDTSPGAVHCDYEKAASLVSELRSQGYIPVFTFQHAEYYRYQPPEEIREDFHIPAKAGAAIVSGSQAHQPQAFEFYQGALIHYGLGNLFFDQYFEGSAQRKSFIDVHVIYNGRHISTELITLQFVDMARPRLMTIEEREYLLKDVYFASGWKY